jgi:hypothetical protein
VMSTWSGADLAPEAAPTPATITPKQQISEINPKRRINGPPALIERSDDALYELVT